MGIPCVLKANDALLLVIDIQKCFEQVIPDFEILVEFSSMVIKAFKFLEIPVLVSEQNPEKLGETVEPLRRKLGESYQPYSKMSFSLLKELRIKREIKLTKRNSLVMIGLEAHVCLLQTALDALKQGYKVFVLDDCVSSRFSYLKSLALERLRTSGAVISSAEIALFELLETAEHSKFKEVQSLIKTPHKF